MGVLLWFCCIFSEYLFPRTPLEGYFCSSQCQGPWSPTVGSKSIFGLKKCNCGENNDKHSTKDYDSIIIIAQKLCFPIRISLVNMTKSAVSCGFGHTYWRNLDGKLQLLCSGPVSCHWSSQNFWFTNVFMRYGKGLYAWNELRFISI